MRWCHRPPHGPPSTCFAAVVGMASSHKNASMKSTSLLLLLPLSTGAFLLPCCERRTPVRQASKCAPSFVSTATLLLSGKKDDDDDDEEANQTGMSEAFRELDALKSLDEPKKKPLGKRKGFENVDVEPLKNEPKATPEAEVELYKDMMSESEKEDIELYADMMTDMGGTPPKPKPQKRIKVQEEETVELLDSLQRSPEDLDVFMNQALQEALEEAKSKTPDELASIDPLDDEEMMEEIKEVFEKANDELLASLEDIRKEQVRACDIVVYYIHLCCDCVHNPYSHSFLLG